MNRKITVLIVILIICGVGYFIYRDYKSAPPADNSTSPTSENSNSSETSNNTPPAKTPSTTPPPTSEPVAQKIVSPISRPADRITKKFFGTYVTPKNSPVQPEKFTGFHTGLDFETFPEEKDSDVNINVICSGKLLVKARATGYGGYAVQACNINGQDVTVVYGHLRQSSITPKVGDQLNAGDHLAVLGTGYSTETDGERKHLHLDIHIGTGVNIKGYVQSKSELSAWMDPQKVLGL